MHAGDADRPGLGVQAVVERRADRQHPAAGTFARFEDDDLASRPPQEVSRAQAGEARADDDDRVSGASVRGVRLGESVAAATARPEPPGRRAGETVDE